MRCATRSRSCRCSSVMTRSWTRRALTLQKNGTCLNSSAASLFLCLSPSLSLSRALLSLAVLSGRPARPDARRGAHRRRNIRSLRASRRCGGGVSGWGFRALALSPVVDCSRAPPSARRSIARCSRRRRFIDPKNGKTALHYAAANKTSHFKLVRMLLQHISTLEKHEKREQDTHFPAMVSVIKSAHTLLVEEEQQQELFVRTGGKARLDMWDMDKNTALHSAAEAGNPGCIDTLLNHKDAGDLVMKANMFNKVTWFGVAASTAGCRGGGGGAERSRVLTARRHAACPAGAAGRPRVTSGETHCFHA